MTEAVKESGVGNKRRQRQGEEGARGRVLTLTVVAIKTRPPVPGNEASTRQSVRRGPITNLISFKRPQAKKDSDDRLTSKLHPIAADRFPALSCSLALFLSHPARSQPQSPPHHSGVGVLGDRVG